MSAAAANASNSLLDLGGYGPLDGEDGISEEDVKEELWAASVVFYDTAGGESGYAPFANEQPALTPDLPGPARTRSRDV